MKRIEIEPGTGKYVELGISGYDEIDNDPSRVMDHYLKHIDSWIKESAANKGLPYSLDESGVIQLKPYRRDPRIKTLLGVKNDFVDIERTESFKTIMLEMTFITGDQQIIDSALGRITN